MMTSAVVFVAKADTLRRRLCGAKAMKLRASSAFELAIHLGRAVKLGVVQRDLASTAQLPPS